MPQPHKGTRVRATVRLPLSVAQRAATQAAARRWSMSQYIAWCVERQQANPGNRDDPTVVPRGTADGSALAAS